MAQLGLARRCLAGALVICAALPAVALSASISAHATVAPVAFTATALSSWQTDGVVWAVAASGGKVFVGGSFGALRPPGSAAGSDSIVRANFAVLDATTGAPSSCAPSLTYPSSPAAATVRSLAVSPDGATLYIGGYFGVVDGRAGIFRNVVALDIATCTIVEAFHPLPNQVVRAIAATGSSVYIGGGFGAVGTDARTRLAALRPVGDPSAGSSLPWAPAADRDVRALALKPDGSAVVLGGDFDLINGSQSHALAVVDGVTGAAVRTYGPTFVPPGSVVKALAVDNTGFYTGNEGTGGGVFDGRIALDWGTYDQRWRDSCLGATQAVVVYRSVLYSGSHAHDCSSMGEFPMAPVTASWLSRSAVQRSSAGSRRRTTASTSM